MNVLFHLTSEANRAEAKNIDVKKFRKEKLTMCTKQKIGIAARKQL